MGEDFSQNNEVLYGNLVKDVHFIFIILVDDESDVSAWELEV